jgi:glycosyltransferase involved in cell wall biosynthesis
MSCISVIILTYNESLHIERCIKSLLPVVSDIFVVDSFSTDNTVAICQKLGAKVVQNPWKNYANQFQWAIDNCEIKTKWTMRMDADEYLEPGLVEEINEKFQSLDDDINGIYLKRKVLFQGRWIRFGGFYPHVLMRIWRTNEGRIEQRWMDEHIVLDNPNSITFKSDIVDHNLNTIGWWIDKHNNYATREMIDLLNIKYDFLPKDRSLHDADDIQARFKRVLKEKIYSNLPAGLRAIIYFFYRYIFRLGFLDGRRGFNFHFLQGFWYRLLVDLKCREIELSMDSSEDIPKLIEKKYGITLVKYK